MGDVARELSGVTAKRCGYAISSGAIVMGDARSDAMPALARSGVVALDEAGGAGRNQVGVDGVAGRLRMAASTAPVAATTSDSAGEVLREVAREAVREVPREPIAEAVAPRESEMPGSSMGRNRLSGLTEDVDDLGRGELDRIVSTGLGRCA
jgi:hypothetical protein